MEMRPTLKAHWQNKLSNYLMNPRLNIAFIGVGNTLMGDDAAGVLLARRLAGLLPKERFLVLEGGLAPENCVGKLREFCPNLVFLLDVVLGLGSAGTIHWLYHDKTDGFSASSHSLPLSILAAYLQAEYGCDVFVLAITAKSLEPDAALSQAVEKAADEILDYLILNSSSRS
jgi:hydrogenase maturation protease HycI